MHYYQFNIGDYKSHTEHLDLLEDLAFRRMIDWCYLHESPLPLDINLIAKKILMRTHCDSIANVLEEFFTKTEDGYFNKRIMIEVEAYKTKSDKARRAAELRWAKVKAQSEGNANALQTQSEGNAKQETLTIKQETENKKQSKDLVVDTPVKKFNFKNELLSLGVDDQVVSDWLIVRKNKKASNTKTALTTMINQAKKANITPAQAVTYANSEGWAGFKADWYFKNMQDVNKNADILQISSDSDWHLGDQGF